MGLLRILIGVGLSLVCVSSAFAHGPRGVGRSRASAQTRASSIAGGWGHSRRSGHHDQRSLTAVPVQWRVLEPPIGRQVKIGKFVPWCAGIHSPRPRISSVREADHGRRVVLTAYVVHRAKGQCGRVETLVSYTVTLKNALGKRRLYDGDVHPPALRWPRG